MPRLFTHVSYTDSKIPSTKRFDVYIVDDITDHQTTNGSITIHMKNTVQGEQDASELELLARSGFLSIVGLTQVTMGAHKEVQSFPQQPTNNLMFYYVHSLMSVTRVLLALGEKEKNPSLFNSKPHIFENIAVDNLIFLCQGIFRMREIGLWNNDQG